MISESNLFHYSKLIDLFTSLKSLTRKMQTDIKRKMM